MTNKDLLKNIVNIQIEIKEIRSRISKKESEIRKLMGLIKKSSNKSKLKSWTKTILSIEKHINKLKRRIRELKQKGEPLLKQLENRLNSNYKKGLKEISIRNALNKELKETDNLLNEFSGMEITFKKTDESTHNKLYDIFISHASEDKDDFVRPLAIKLIEMGLKVWYDEFTLEIGDSLRKSIDEGLANSRYGLVILSTYFFNKNWTAYELNGLVTNELNDSQKTILPIWHKVTIDEIRKHSPSIADKFALNSAVFGSEEIANKIFKAVQNSK